MYRLNFSGQDQHTRINPNNSHSTGYFNPQSRRDDILCTQRPKGSWRRSILTTMLAMAFCHQMAPTKAFADQIRVLTPDGEPVAGATLILGDETGKNPGRSFTTDADGFAPIPSDWKSLESLSVRAEGFIPSSFLLLEPKNMELQIHPEDARQYIEVKGQSTGFSGIKKDGKIDVGLVYPALSRRDLIQFDISSVISPETDQIKVITEKVGIPSNLTLPKQKESYILPFTLDKPQYRMYVRRPGQYRVTVNHGQFPLKTVINEIKDGKSIFQVINHFQFKSAGQRDVHVEGDLAGQTISVNEIHFDRSVQLKAPQLDAGTGVVSANLVNQDGLFYLSDIKGLQSEQSSELRAPATSDNYVLSLLTRESKPDIWKKIEKALAEIDGFAKVAQYFNYHLNLALFGESDGQPTAQGLALSLQRATKLVQPQFLSLVNPPTKLTERHFELDSPKTLEGVQAVATYMVLSEIQKTTSGEKEFAAEKRFRLWENYQAGWATTLQLPHLNIRLEEGKVYRWEVFFLGRSEDSNASSNYFLDGITHLSRTSLDIK